MFPVLPQAVIDELAEIDTTSLAAIRAKLTDAGLTDEAQLATLELARRASLN